MPKGALAKSRAFSATVCGAWSVASTSMVPSAIAALSSARSRFVRSGGFIFACVS